MADDNKHIEVDPDYATSPEAGMNESQVVNAVLQALAGSPEIDAAAVEIQINKGVVHLSGQVDNEAAKELAEDLTRNVPGVHGVENNLIAMAPTPLSEFPSRTANRPAEQ